VADAGCGPWPQRIKPLLQQLKIPKTLQSSRIFVSRQNNSSANFLAESIHSFARVFTRARPNWPVRTSPGEHHGRRELQQLSLIGMSRSGDCNSTTDLDSQSCIPWRCKSSISMNWRSLIGLKSGPNKRNG
jgi:hypothetical protein